MAIMTMLKLWASVVTFLSVQIRATVIQKICSNKSGEMVEVEVTEIWLGHIYESEGHESEGGSRSLLLGVDWFCRKAVATEEWRRDLHEQSIVLCSLDAEARDMGGYGLWEIRIKSTRLRYAPTATLILASEHKVAYYPSPHKG